MALPPWLQGLPNQLTFARIAAVPLLLLLYPINFLPSGLTSALQFFCAVLFAFAALTDLVDGWVARKYGMVTRLGAILDPLADKLLTASALIVLAYTQRVYALIAGLLLCRDITVSALRMMALEHGQDLAVSMLGKWKTIAVDVAIFCLLLNYDYGQIPFKAVGWISMWIGLGLSLYSGYDYAMRFWHMTKDANISPASQHS
jgi:CDP-diacylglycerol---glycerol-3-phosphate 3-phosphatidyltransferase